MAMRAQRWLMAAWSLLGCSGVEVEALSLRSAVDMASGSSSGMPDLGRPGPPRGSMRRQGDGRTCQSATLWKLSAQQDCRSRGERLDVLMPFDPCGVDRFRVITYTCCTLGTPAPGPTGNRPGQPGLHDPTTPTSETPSRGGLAS